MGFEPTNVGFANRCLRPLGYPAVAWLRREYIPAPHRCQVYIFSFVDFLAKKAATSAPAGESVTLTRFSLTRERDCLLCRAVFKIITAFYLDKAATPPGFYLYIYPIPGVPSLRDSTPRYWLPSLRDSQIPRAMPASFYNCPHVRAIYLYPQRNITDCPAGATTSFLARFTLTRERDCGMRRNEIRAMHERDCAAVERSVF